MNRVLLKDSVSNSAGAEIHRAIMYLIDLTQETPGASPGTPAAPTPLPHMEILPGWGPGVPFPLISIQKGGRGSKGTEGCLGPIWSHRGKEAVPLVLWSGIGEKR